MIIISIVSKYYLYCYFFVNFMLLAFIMIYKKNVSFLKCYVINLHVRKMNRLLLGNGIYNFLNDERVTFCHVIP